MLRTVPHEYFPGADFSRIPLHDHPCPSIAAFVANENLRQGWVGVPMEEGYVGSTSSDLLVPDEKDLSVFFHGVTLL